MKTAVISVAFYSENFSKVLICSFRKYYPKIPLVIIDNNVEREMGVKETRYLQSRGDIKYIKNISKVKHHGAALDLGIRYLHGESFDLIITIDIDCLILKKGIVEICQEYFGQGYKHGGRKGKRQDGYIHPQCSFLCPKTFVKLRCSFINTLGYDCGEEAAKTFDEHDSMGPKYFNTKEYVEHFGCGSLMRENGKWGHCTYRDPVKGEALRRKYIKRKEEFFSREDVKVYL